MRIRKKRVVVIGAGIAGLATARALLADGHEVEVYEAAPELRATGGSVTLWPGATGILRELGVDPAARGSRLSAMESYTTRGRRLFTVDLADIERRLGRPSVHIVRRDLVELLAEGVPITYGAEVAAVDPDRAEATLADGRTIGGDVLVGADGRRSVVRGALWEQDPARLSGWVTWQGFVSEPDSGVIRMATGRQGLFSLAPAGGDRLLWWFDTRAAPGSRLWEDEPDPVAALRERFGSWRAGPLQWLWPQLGDAQFFPHYRHAVPEVWGRGAVTLAGDSAHTMPPALAQGANQGIEDAWALRGSLEDLRAYERGRAKVVRRPAVLAGFEMTSRPQPPMPSALVTGLFARLLRAFSGYLLTTPEQRRILGNVPESRI
ncbi:FAD-dependent oxidoreductase [Nonomuraea sp. NPDC050328]|uniref:FAD-dependent oxidoreductase n=1 Tax=Nonomuraea sp. NPDC050328 TaxID=3364361 RepID=UPI0037BCBF6A